MQTGNKHSTFFKKKTMGRRRPLVLTCFCSLARGCLQRWKILDFHLVALCHKLNEWCDEKDTFFLLGVKKRTSGATKEMSISGPVNGRMLERG